MLLKKNYNFDWSCKLLWLSGQKSKVRFTSADRAAAVLRRSMPILEAFRLRSHQINVTICPPRSIFNSDSRSQRTNRLNKWMLLNTEHFSPSVCSQWCLSNCWGHEVCPCRPSLTCPVRFHLTVLINTHYTGLAFCSHKLLVGIQFSSTGNAACNHYSGLTVLYGSPRNP